MILEKILLGMSLSAPFGPLSAEALRRGLNGGFSHVFQVRFGGAIGNTTCLIIAYYSLSFLMQNPSFSSVAGFIGSVMLILLGYNNLRSARKKTSVDQDKESENNRLALLFSNCLLVGFILAIANPFGIVWWFSVFTTSMINETNNVNAATGFAPNLLVIVGVLIWVMIFSSLVAFGHMLLNKKVISWINVISSLVLMWYGINYGIISFKQLPFFS